MAGSENMKTNVVEMFSGGGENSPTSTLQVLVAAMCLQPGINGHYLDTTLCVLAETPGLTGPTRIDILQLAKIARAVEDARLAPE